MRPLRAGDGETRRQGEGEIVPSLPLPVILSRTLLPSFLLTLLLTGPAAAQVPSDTVTVADPVAEALTRTVDPTTGNVEALAALLADLTEEPLDLNTATAEELAVLPALTPLLAHRITTFRQREGPFAAVRDLLAVPGMTSALLNRTRPYVTTRPPSEERDPYPPVLSFHHLMRGLTFDFTQRVTGRLDLGRGYSGDTTHTTFLGSPLRIKTRLRIRSDRHLSINLTLDKDRGEPFRWHPASQTYGYDHATAHLALRDIGRLKTLVIGDFTAEFGQGLTLWSGGAFGGGRNPIANVARSGRGLDPYGSTGENRFFRGLGATVRLTPRLSLSAFASRRTLDATVFEADTAGTTVATSLTEGSLHRTPSELARKDALRETVLGGAVEYRLDAMRLGLVSYRARFGAMLAPGDAAYERFHFAGRTATMVSLYGTAYFGPFLLFGEVGRGPTGTVGAIGGLMAALPRSASFVVAARRLPPDMASLHGAVFGARSGPPRNEIGLYLGLKLHPARRWTISASMDQYRFPWIRYAVPRPSSGYEAQLVVEHRLREWLTWYLQLQTETHAVGADLRTDRGRLLEGLQHETHQSARLHVEYLFHPRLRLQARVEITRYAAEPRLVGAPRYGVLVYQDVHFAPLEDLRLYARLAFFDTEGWKTRAYTYENDLLYSFSIPAFYGEGQRAYVLVKWSPVEALDLEAKYGVTRFLHVERIGSGLNEIPGNRRRAWGVQLRLSF